MISTEQAYDMLPHFVDLYDKLDIDGFRKEFKEKYPEQKADELAVGYDLIKYVLKHSGRVKDEVFAVIAAFEQKPVDQIKAQSFGKTILSLRALLSDKEAIDFFRQAMQ